MSNPVQIPIDIAQLKTMLAAAGMSFDGEKVIVNASQQNSTSLWSGIYTFISDQITSAINNGLVSAADVKETTQYWFENAPAINANQTSIASVEYIRGDTRYGLLYRDKIENLGEAATQNGLQITSNLIGQNVVSEILRDGGIPIFATMITGDISAAIGGGDNSVGAPVSPLWQQTIGGWGGAFYYWAAPLNYPNTPVLTVGDAIVNGNAMGKGTLQTQPSLTEFYYANANAAADFSQSLVVTALQGAGQTLSRLPILGAAGPFFSPALLKAIHDGLAAYAASVNSSAPINVENAIQADMTSVLLGRVITGNLFSASYGYVGITGVSTDPSGVTTTSYTNGSSYSEKFNSGGAGLVDTWTLSTGTGSASIDSAGDFVLNESDNSGQFEVAVFNANGISSGEIGSIKGTISIGNGDDDTLNGGAGETFSINLQAGAIEAINDKSGSGIVYIGTQLVAASGAVQSGAIDTWIDSSGTMYQYGSNDPVSGLGVMTITGGVAAGGALEIDDFNLLTAETTSAGFMGIKLPGSLKISAGAVNAQGVPVAGVSNMAAMPIHDTQAMPIVTFAGGTTENFTITADAASTSSRNVTVLLSGASPADFIASFNGAEIPLGASGSFTLTLPMGMTQTTFGLTDVSKQDGTSDIAGGAQLQLIATLNNPSNTAILSNAFNISYIPETSSPNSAVNFPISYYGAPLSGDYDGATEVPVAFRLPSGRSYAAFGC